MFTKAILKFHQIIKNIIYLPQKIEPNNSIFNLNLMKNSLYQNQFSMEVKCDPNIDFFIDLYENEGVIDLASGLLGRLERCYSKDANGKLLSYQSLFCRQLCQICEV